MSKHTAGGKINTTTVVGNALVPFLAVDGGINVVIDDASHVGIYHPSGAMRINSGTGATYYDASGAAYSNHVLGPGK